MEIQSDSNDIPYNKITSIFLTLFFDKKFPYDSNSGLYYDRDFSSVSLFSMPKHFPDLHPKELYVKVHDILNRNFGERPFLGKTYPFLSHWDRALQSKDIMLFDVYNLIFKIIKGFFTKHNVYFYSWNNSYDARIKLPKNLLFSWAESFLSLDESGARIQKVPLVLSPMTNPRKKVTVYVDFENVAENSGPFLLEALFEAKPLKISDLTSGREERHLLRLAPIGILNSQSLSPIARNYFLDVWGGFYQKWTVLKEKSKLLERKDYESYFAEILYISIYQAKKLYDLISSNIFGLDYIRTLLKQEAKKTEEIGKLVSKTDPISEDYLKISKFINDLVESDWDYFYSFLEFFCVVATVNFLVERSFAMPKGGHSDEASKNVVDYYRNTYSNLVSYIGKHGAFGSIPMDFVKFFTEGSVTLNYYNSHETIIPFEKLYICFLDYFFEEIGLEDYDKEKENRMINLLIEKITFEDILKRGKRLIPYFWKS